jgi:hypothetical protein
MFEFHTLSGTDVATWQRKNARRYIAYQRPGGAAPLAAILSLADPEETDGPEYSWTEERWVNPNLTLVPTGAGAGPMFSADGTTQSGTYTVTTATSAGLHATSYKFKVASVVGVLPGEILGITRTPTTVFATASGTCKRTTWRVISVDSTLSQIEVKCLTCEGVAAGSTFTLDNAGTNTWSALPTTARTVHLMGSANKEGSTSTGSLGMKWPTEVSNYCQIFRDPKSFSANLLQQPMQFSESGVYKREMLTNGVNHLIKLEQSMLFGRKLKTTVTGSDGQSEVVRYTGGLLYYMEEWEKANGGAFQYRPSGSAATLNSDDNKRIIDCNDTTKAWAGADGVKSYIQRVFRKTMSQSFEKLVLCGDGFADAFSTFFGDKFTRNTGLKDEHGFGMMDIHSLSTPYGTLHFKTHPLMTANELTRYDGFIIDVPGLKWRHTKGRDTYVRENIHTNDFDGRRDEHFTEGGLEVCFPESHMYIRGLTGLTGGLT